MTALFHNNAASTLALQAQLIDTVLTVSAGTGNRFPAPAATEWFFATIQSGMNYEIVKCTARAGDVLTVVRAQDGTSARLWSAGASIDMRIPKIVLESFLQEIADTAVTTAKLADASVTMAKLTFDGSAISGALNFAPEVDVASAGTTDIGAAASNNVRITGITTITSFGTAASGITRQLRFAAALTLTYNATSLILPGGANIIAAAGDTATAVSLGSGNWVVVHYTAATTAGARAVIGAAPQPQTATGVGRFEAVDTSASVGNGYSLPAGGTWAYFMFRVNSSTGGVPGGSNMAAGVAAGGTTILAGLASHFIYGFAWRIA